MKRARIVVLTKGEQVETWSNLKKACQGHGWEPDNPKQKNHPWNYKLLIKEKLPLTIEGWKVQRTPYL